MRQLTRRYARHLLLLVPLTWPGFLYGLWQHRRRLWQHRRRLWLSLPRPPVGQWAQRVATHPGFVPYLKRTGMTVVVIASLYGAIVYGGPWITGLLTPSVPTTALDGEAIHATDVLDELVTIMASMWVQVLLMVNLVGMLVILSTGYLRLSAGMSKWIMIVLLGGLGLSGFLSMLALPGLK